MVCRPYPEGNASSMGSEDAPCALQQQSNEAPEPPETSEWGLTGNFRFSIVVGIGRGGGLAVNFGPSRDNRSMSTTETGSAVEGGRGWGTGRADVRTLVRGSEGGSGFDSGTWREG